MPVVLSVRFEAMNASINAAPSSRCSTREYISVRAPAHPIPAG